MPSHIDNVLELIRNTRSYLKLYADPILAEVEDCDYFRKKFKKNREERRNAPEKGAGSLCSPALLGSAPFRSEPDRSLDLRESDQLCAELPVQSPLASPSPIKLLLPKPSAIQEPVFSAAFKPSSVKEPNPPKQQLASETEENRTLAASPSSVLPQHYAQSRERAEGSGERYTFPYQRWKTLLASVAPQLHTIAEIPSDALAKKIASRWKTKNQTAPITLLYYQEIPEQKELLEQIAKALDVHFGPAKLIAAGPIEKEKQWEAFLSVSELKLVLCCDYTLWQLPNLLHFYKEVPNLKTRQIGEKALLLLPDLSLYLKDPPLKRSLWKALCQVCAPVSQ